MTSPSETFDYFRLFYAGKQEREHFALMLLDSQHKVLECNVIFSGTIDGASTLARSSRQLYMVMLLLSFATTAVILTWPFRGMAFPVHLIGVLPVVSCKRYSPFPRISTTVPSILTV